MRMPSYIMVNCLTMEDEEVTNIRKSVAFPVAKTKEGRSLFATCSHTVIDHFSEGLPYQLLYSDGSPLPGRLPLMNNVIPSKLNVDLSFFEVDVDREMSAARFDSRSTLSVAELSHVRNVSHGSEFPGETAQVTTQTSKGKSEDYMFSDGKLLVVADAMKRMPRRTKFWHHKSLLMRSWPGVSGSPLWNKYGKVVGMVAGGTDELPGKDGHILVYLPAKQIQSYLKKYLSHKIA